MPLEHWDPNERFKRVIMLVYGAAGAGKTVFGATAPKPLFADLERGMASIKREGVGRWPIDGVKDWGPLFTFLRTENNPESDSPHSYQTLVVDSLNELQRQLNDYVLSQAPDVGKRPFGGQQMNQGDWGYALNLLENKFIREFLKLDMNVVLLCNTSGVVGAEGKVEPALYGKSTVAMVTRYMHVVGYMHVRRRENELPEHVMGFHLAHAVSKDRSGTLPSEVVNPTWDKLAAYWNPPVAPTAVAAD